LEHVKYVKFNTKFFTMRLRIFLYVVQIMRKQCVNIICMRITMLVFFSRYKIFIAREKKEGKKINLQLCFFHYKLAGYRMHVVSKQIQFKVNMTCRITCITRENFYNNDIIIITKLVQALAFYSRNSETL